MHDELRQRCQQARSGLARLTQDLIRTPSYSLREGALADKVQAGFEALEYDLIYRDGAGNVIAILVGSEDGPTVLLTSHMDTRRAVDAELWQEDPFSGRVRDDRLYGLGAADAKGGLAAQIYAGAILGTGVLQRGTLVVAATVADEEGCGVGLQHLLADSLPKLGFSPQLIILGEPTSLWIRAGHTGWVELDLHIRGADPYDVTQSVDNVLHQLQAYVSDQPGPNHIMHVYEPRYSDEAHDALLLVRKEICEGKSVEDCTRWLLHRAGGVLPASRGVAVAVEPHTERQRLYTGLAKKVLRSSSPWNTSGFELVLDIAEQMLRDVGWQAPPPRAWRRRNVHLGTAGGLPTERYRIPTFAFGPGEETRAQQPDESVAIDNLVDATFGNTVLVHDLIGAARFGWATAP